MHGVRPRAHATTSSDAHFNHPQVLAAAHPTGGYDQMDGSDQLPAMGRGHTANEAAAKRKATGSVEGDGAAASDAVDGADLGNQLPPVDAQAAVGGTPATAEAAAAASHLIDSAAYATSAGVEGRGDAGGGGVDFNLRVSPLELLKAPGRTISAFDDDAYSFDDRLEVC